MTQERVSRREAIESMGEVYRAALHILDNDVAALERALATARRFAVYPKGEGERVGAGAEQAMAEIVIRDIDGVLEGKR